MRLKGKVAIITGGATGLIGEIRGIGGAAAWAFVREGATVYIADIDDEMGERTAEQIRQSGGAAHFVHLDVTVEDLWRSAIGLIAENEGGLDVLVNNAGIGIPDYGGDFSDPSGPSSAEEALKVEFTTVEGLERELRVHARGTLLGMKHCIPQMRRRGGRLDHQHILDPWDRRGEHSDVLPDRKGSDPADIQGCCDPVRG